MISQNLILLQPFDDGKCGLFGGTDGGLIAIVETQEAAERLLIAWNCHQDLVDALKAAIPYLPHIAGGTQDVLHPVLSQARAALKKATSQP